MLPVTSDSVLINTIAVSDKFEYSYEGFKHYNGYKDDDIIRPLSIILRQISGYIKHSENGGKDMC